MIRSHSPTILTTGEQAARIVKIRRPVSTVRLQGAARWPPACLRFGIAVCRAGGHTLVQTSRRTSGSRSKGRGPAASRWCPGSKSSLDAVCRRGSSNDLGAFMTCILGARRSSAVDRSACRVGLCRACTVQNLYDRSSDDHCIAYCPRHTGGPANGQEFRMPSCTAITPVEQTGWRFNVKARRFAGNRRAARAIC